jgi:hypothetical protein
MDKTFKYTDQQRCVVCGSYDVEDEDGVVRKLCLAIALVGPNAEPVACAYEAGHTDPHSWGTLVTEWTPKYHV